MLARESFDLMFALQGRASVVILFNKTQALWLSAAKEFGSIFKFTAMLAPAPLKVIADAGVKAVVTALDYINHPVAGRRWIYAVCCHDVSMAALAGAFKESFFG